MWKSYTFLGNRYRNRRVAIPCVPGPGGGGVVPGPGGCTWTQGDVPGPGGVTCPGTPPLWTEFLIHASENITLPQTSFASGNYEQLYSLVNM